MTEQATTEETYFLPFSGLDATNYLVIASQVKVAAHAEVPADKLHFVNDLRSILHLHKQSYRTVVDEDGSIRKSTSRDVIERMEDFLQRLDAEALRLCFRMWSVSTAQELVKLALAEAEAVDTDCNPDLDPTKGDDNRYGAIVAFLIVPFSLSVMIPDSGNSHCEICVCQVFDFESLHDELAGA